MADQIQSKFELIKKSDELLLDNGIVILCSIQNITSGRGNVSKHLVISKIQRNADGSQRGLSKQIFLPFSSVEKILKTINSLLVK